MRATRFPPKIAAVVSSIGRCRMQGMHRVRSYFVVYLRSESRHSRGGEPRSATRSKCQYRCCTGRSCVAPRTIPARTERKSGDQSPSILCGIAFTSNIRYATRFKTFTGCNVQLSTAVGVVHTGRWRLLRQCASRLCRALSPGQMACRENT